MRRAKKGPKRQKKKERKKKQQQEEFHDGSRLGSTHSLSRSALRIASGQAQGVRAGWRRTWTWIACVRGLCMVLEFFFFF